MAHILIIGASKGIGLETVKYALAEGHNVTAFARSASDVSIDSEKLTKLNGDARSTSDVEGAVANTDVVIQALGVPLNTKLLTGPITLFSEATKILLPALKKAGVKRLIAVTGYGAGDSEATIPTFQRIPFNIVFGHAYRDKSLQEEMIKNSDLDWVIARPGVLTNGRKTERYEITTDHSKMKNGVISRADVAHFLVNQIKDDRFVHSAPVLRGGLI
ncbi:MAG: SDR family oxidoreductase [Pseudomonadota bacterium]